MLKTNPSLFFVDGEAPGAPGLKGSLCKACGQTVLLQVAACPKCGSRALDTVCIGQSATLKHCAAEVRPMYSRAPAAPSWPCQRPPLAICAKRC
jgi:hypothetical protein